jgi:hypothetical protein
MKLIKTDSGFELSDFNTQAKIISEILDKNATRTYAQVCRIELADKLAVIYATDSFSLFKCEIEFEGVDGFKCFNIPAAAIKELAKNKTAKMFFDIDKAIVSDKHFNLSKNFYPNCELAINNFDKDKATETRILGEKFNALKHFKAPKIIVSKNGLTAIGPEGVLYLVELVLKD